MTKPDKQKITYVKCPRCDLNYIDSRQDMCDICKAELGLAPNILLDDDIDLMDRELCPICKRNFIEFDEEMCDDCRKAKLIPSLDKEEDDDGWRTFVDDEPPEEEEESIEIPLEDLKDEELATAFDDEENLDDEENPLNDDDFEELDLDDLDDFDDDDDDDDDEDEDDD